MSGYDSISRRHVLKVTMGSVTGLILPKLGFAQTANTTCKRTPLQGEGPFYPVKDQPDKDNDLTLVKGSTSHAEGDLIYVVGQVTDETCQPLSNILVEIWQANKHGRYSHPADQNTRPLDPNFQGWGWCKTEAQGRYSFKTIIPGPYPAMGRWIRPPHIHFKIHGKGVNELITQMYFEGNEYNEKDLLLSQLSEQERAQLIVKPEDPSSSEFEHGSKVCTFNLTLKRA
jgi:protocatechuate 3,4-dioxygenase beta subunit